MIDTPGLFPPVCSVVNVNTKTCTVYIGRPSKWGNPFVVGRDGDRKAVIEKYKNWLPHQQDLIQALRELKNQSLGCHCKPKDCHGDILAELVNNLP